MNGLFWVSLVLFVLAFGFALRASRMWGWHRACARVWQAASAALRQVDLEKADARFVEGWIAAHAALALELSKRGLAGTDSLTDKEIAEVWADLGASPKARPTEGEENN